MNISERLRAARASTGKTQERVAAEAGMHVTQYNGYERGRSRPAPPTLERLAVALGTTPQALEGAGQNPGSADGAFGSTTSHAVAILREAFREQVAALLKVAPESLAIRIELS